LRRAFRAGVRLSGRLFCKVAGLTTVTTGCPTAFLSRHFPASPAPEWSLVREVTVAIRAAQLRGVPNLRVNYTSGAEKHVQSCGGDSINFFLGLVLILVGIGSGATALACFSLLGAITPPHGM